MPATEPGIKFTHELTLTTYWTPDGRELHKLPNMHGTTNGQVRDANLDNGWLTHKPTRAERQLYCPHCDKWHKTQPLVDECGAVKRANAAKWESHAKKQINQADEIAVLKSEMTEIKSMLKQLLEGK